MSKLVTCNSLGRFGRLCNGLYQIAGVIGIARRNGFDFAFPQFINWDHKERFGSTEDIEVYKHFVNPLPLYDGPPLPDRGVEWGYHEVVLSESCSLSGHFQSTRYFEHAIDEVRWYFRMKDEYPQSDYVAVHCRLADYDGGYHPRMTMDYYSQAMKEFPGAKFLVFSDDLKTAREMFGSGVEYATGDYLDDFKRMKSCRHFIIGNSSYSAMAAVLGEAKDKRVVAPRPWFGKSYTGITGEDIYSEGWKVIDWERVAA